MWGKHHNKIKWGSLVYFYMIENQNATTLFDHTLIILKRERFRGVYSNFALREYLTREKYYDDKILIFFQGWGAGAGRSRPFLREAGTILKKKMAGSSSLYVH